MNKKMRIVILSIILMSTAVILKVVDLQPVLADAVTDTITVSVGYFGWGEDQYVEKATYHWTNLDDLYGGALPTHKQIYSYYSGSRTYLVAARGFLVRDLLKYAGIDINNIASIDFFTKDQKGGAYRSFTAQSLFNTPRYYFPNLAANEETGEQYPFDGDNIWNGANLVEAMLALENFTEWDVSGTEFEEIYDPNMLSPNCRFHLYFGQTDPTESSTSSAAKYCYKLHITFSGKPVLITEDNYLEMNAGSDHKIEIDVDAEDRLLNDYVRQNITWSSSDDSVVSVAQDGTLSAYSAGDAQITASFMDSQVVVNVHVSQSFSDVEPDSYYAKAVNWAVKNRITKGTSSTTFSPLETCTRGEAVTFLWRANGSKIVSGVRNPFTDVKESDYYYEAVLWAYSNHITSGVTTKTFGPGEKCTRGQIVTFLWRTEGFPDSTGKVSFKDVATNEYYFEPVRWAVEKEITKGTSQTQFSPDDPCTRGQIVTFLYRANKDRNNNSDVYSIRSDVYLVRSDASIH